MVLYGESGVEDAPVLEELLFGLLHLDDECLALLVLAINVEDGAAVSKAVAQVLAVEVSEVVDDLLALEERVKETD